MKTFRRDKLRRLVEAGRVVVVSSYHYDDNSGSTRSTEPLPVAIMPADWHDRKDGVCYLFPSCFTSKSGTCYESPNGVISLIVHGNSNYDFRIVPATEASAPRVAVVCSECGRRWHVSPNAATLQCAKCNSVDIEVANA